LELSNNSSLAKRQVSPMMVVEHYPYG
jgi:hypothetical protein